MDIESRKKIDEIKEKMWKDSVKVVMKHLCKKCGKVIVNSLSTSYMGVRYGRCKC